MRLALAAAVVAALLLPVAAGASPYARYGVQDDAYLGSGPSLEPSLQTLDELGVGLVRYMLNWRQIAPVKPRHQTNPGDKAYDWSSTDAILGGLHAHGIQVLVTLYRAPAWANGGKGSNVAPTGKYALADFAVAVAKRYPWLRLWEIWNEPNLQSFLKPNSPQVYVQRLLNPAYAELHAAIPGAKVAGGVTAPRAGSAGIAPVPWIREMGDARAKLDAYAHNPYPGRPQSETPWGPKCVNCQNITMADLERLEREVAHAFGHKPIWLTEYGYQTNPPDIYLGVSPQKQAAYVSSAAMRVFKAPSVAMLIFFMVRDDPDPAGWQSGFLTEDGTKKPSYAAFRFPLVQTSRRGGHMGLWGQVRSGPGKQPYRVRLEEDDEASWIGGTRWTDENGFFSITVAAPPGSRVRIWSPRDAVYGYELIVR